MNLDRNKQSVMPSLPQQLSSKRGDSWERQIEPHHRRQLLLPEMFRRCSIRLLQSDALQEVGSAVHLGQPGSLHRRNLLAAYHAICAKTACWRPDQRRDDELIPSPIDPSWPRQYVVFPVNAPIGSWLALRYQRHDYDSPYPFIDHASGIEVHPPLTVANAIKPDLVALVVINTEIAIAQVLTLNVLIVANPVQQLSLFRAAILVERWRHNHGEVYVFRVDFFCQVAAIHDDFARDALLFQHPDDLAEAIEDGVPRSREWESGYAQLTELVNASDVLARF